jgi:DNA-directed RNA polymerase sigma subunit (sigma70/sigma32)
MAKKKPKEDREVTNREIAEELGLTTQRVQQIETRALAKLRKLLEEQGLKLEDFI